MNKTLDKLVELRGEGLTWKEIVKKVKGYTANGARKAYYRYVREESEPRKQGPKVLFLDIETSSILSHTWGLFDQNVALNQIEQDWNLLSWSAKWLNDKKVMYQDIAGKDVRDDRPILQTLWELLDECDVAVGHNLNSFDIKKIFSRFLLNGYPPPSSFRTIDTLRVAKKYFNLTSNKLEYLSHKLCKKYKKLKHGKFSGFTLWAECLKNNPKAWAEMKKYNIYDTLALEELYVDHLMKWDKSIRFSSYSDDVIYRCNCGSSKFKQKGYIYTNKAKYARYICKSCGSEHKHHQNIMTKEKKQSVM